MQHMLHLALIKSTRLKHECAISGSFLYAIFGLVGYVPGWICITCTMFGPE